MKRIFFVFVFFLFFKSNFAQISQPSIHQLELEFYNSLGLTTDAQYESVTGFNGAISQPKKKSCDLQKIVFGWNPYWMTSQYQNFQWSLLSDFCYFSYEFSATTGAVTNSHSFFTASSVTAALSNGKRVHLCVTLFNDFSTFFASSTAQQTLITNLIAAVKQRNAHGINVDFEGVPTSEKTNFTNFMKTLSQRFHDSIPNSKVSICLPSVDWASSYDVLNMNNDAVASRNVDWFIIMGYDYYYGGSTTAGPTDPLYPFQSSSTSCLSKTFTYYANKIPSTKLIMGLPNYGRQWQVSSTGIPAATVSGTGTAKTYKQIKDNTYGYYSASNAIWNNDAFSVCYQFQDAGLWYQCFVNNPYSWGRRLDMTNQRNFAGIGIWALGNDDGYSELWDKISQKFSTCSMVACSDSVFDMGGPNRNYFDNEQYSYTIAPTGASSVCLTFTEFLTEATYDTLFIYNGNSTASPLIGTYHGSNSPGTVNASGNALTLRFKSDGATNKSGWRAIWNCTVDNTPPSTQINLMDSSWVTSSFTSTFTDEDNAGGSGVNSRFYQVINHDGTAWYANENRGFAYDDFDLLNANRWTVNLGGGTWSAVGGALYGSDSINDNTNIYASLNGSLSDIYMYEFTTKVDGPLANKRFGFHFACDSASLANRGNSYFIYFRPASQQLEFYKVINNTYTQTKVVTSVATNLNTYYRIRILHNRITGLIEVYRDDVLLSSWTDPSPLTTPSKYYSFRSGQCKMWVKNFRVYRSRNASESISVGPSNTNDLRWQSRNSSIAGKIVSIVKDNVDLFSTIKQINLKIDYTIPSLTTVNDGLSSDLDIFGTQGIIRGNWTTAIDTNSGIQKYMYAVGTTAGASNIVAWTDNGLALNFERTALTLLEGTTYYISVKVQNGASLWSSVVSSNGAVFHLQPIADFTSNATQICTGSSIQFTNLSANYTGQTWYFSGGSPATSNSVSPSVTYATAGNYPVILVVTGASGKDSLCRTSFIHVQTMPNPPVIVSNSPVCQGSISQLVVYANDTIKWYDSPSGGIILGYGPTYQTGILNQIETYYVRSESGSCMSSMTIIDAPVETMPSIPVLSTPTPVCFGNSSTITATGMAQIKWYSDEFANNLVYAGAVFNTPNLTQNETYFVRTETQYCITPMSMVTQQVYSVPLAPQVVAYQECCFGDSLLLHADGNAEIYWFSSINGSNAFATGNNYQTPAFFNGDTLYLKSKENGCYSNFSQIEINVHELPQTPIINFVSGQLCADGVGDYQWFFNAAIIENELNSCINPLANGNYSARVINNLGCMSLLSENYFYNANSVFVNNASNSINIYPNPFNDMLSISFDKSLNVKLISIYNSIGQLVFVQHLADNCSNVFEINTSEFSKGIYLINVETEKAIFSIKVMKDN